MLLSSGHPKRQVVVSLLLALTALLAVSARDALGQSPTAASVTGKIVSIGEDWIKVVSPIDKIPVTVVVSAGKLQSMFPNDKPPRSMQVLVTGDAELNFLAKDQCVTFSTELTGGRTGSSDVTEVTLFTPDAQHALELMSTAPSLDASGAPSEQSGTYMVSGRIQSIRDGQLTVQVPNEKGKLQQVRVHLADSAKIKLRLSDFSVARAGDAVEVTGHTYTALGQPVTTIIAEKMTISGAKPFINAKRAKALALASRTPPKPERKPRPTKPAEAEEAADDAPAAAPQATAAPPSPKAAMPGAPKPGATGVLARQPGDPPAEPLVLRDEFSVDQAAEEETPKGAKRK